MTGQIGFKPGHDRSGSSVTGHDRSEPMLAPGTTSPTWSESLMTGIPGQVVHQTGHTTSQVATSVVGSVSSKRTRHKLRRSRYSSSSDVSSESSSDSLESECSWFYRLTLVQPLDTTQGQQAVSAVSGDLSSTYDEGPDGTFHRPGGSQTYFATPSASAT